MLVHITFDDKEAIPLLSEMLITQGLLININTKRLERYGILTGNILKNRIDEVASLQGIRSVRIDTVMSHRTK